LRRWVIGTTFRLEQCAKFAVFILNEH